MVNRQAVFLDLNGTLVLPLKQERLGELVLIPGAAEAVARLSAAGFVCPVITVQSRIAKGLFTATEFDDWFRQFALSVAAIGGHLVGPYVCPHRFADPCACKKPNRMLYDRAAHDHDIAVERSFVIGDSPDDVRAARRIGAVACLVRTGWAADPLVAVEGAADADIVTPAISDAVEWILAEKFDERTPIGAPPSNERCTSR